MQKTKAVEMILKASIGLQLLFYPAHLLHAGDDPVPTPGRDWRLDQISFSSVPVSGFKSSTSSRMDFLPTNAKKIPIGVSKKSGENPKLVVVHEVTADEVTPQDLDEVVSACYGPTADGPIERSLLRLIQTKPQGDEIRKRMEATIAKRRLQQAEEKKCMMTRMSEVLSHLKADSYFAKSEDESHKVERTEDHRKPLKWYTWHAGIGEKDDPTLSEGFGELWSDYLPQWCPSNDFANENYRNDRANVVAFKIDHDCLKKAWKGPYARASKRTQKCEIEFKPGSVKSGESFDPKTLKSLTITGVKKGSKWTEFPVKHARIQSLWCDPSVTTFADLSHFFDLSTSDMKLQEQYFNGVPTPTPEPTPEAVEPAPSDRKKVKVKATTSGAPALNQNLKKEVPTESGESRNEKKSQKTESKTGS